VALQAGDRVGRYEIRASIGEGGFGQVYQAWDPEFERMVAIKELSFERQESDPAKYAEYRERFKLERRVQGQFQHPHIVRVYDLVQQEENEYLVEEFVEGGTLRALLEEKGCLPPERAVQIGAEMCQAIAATWERDIVHRDIKPSNILLTIDGHARLNDFGVAQLGQMSQRTQTDNRHPGTPAYMSPEQERGGGYLDERSDLYALGLVLYEALSGKSFKRERVPVRQLSPAVPKKLEQVIMRALAQEPEERYQRAYDFEMALRDALRQPSRGKWWWVGGGLVIVLIAIGGAMLFPAPKSSSPVPTVTQTVTATPSKTPPLPTATLLSPTPSRVMATPSVTPTVEIATSTPGLAPVISAPRLVDPAGASLSTSSKVSLRWEGELPNQEYGFLVKVHSASYDLTYTSPVLDSQQWTVELAGEAVGEWTWSVSIVKRRDTQEVMARSAEWTFYYNPFPSSFRSPLASPLQTPAP